MNISNKIPTILLILIALVFTLLISEIVPEKQFEPYRLSLDSTWRKETNSQEYIVDLNNDSAPERLTHKMINEAGILEIQQSGRHQLVARFAENEKVISKYMHFADIDNDSTKEILFISVNENILYLHIIGYDFDRQFPYLIERLKIDSLNHSLTSDIDNHFIISNKNDIYFDIHAGYTVQPRRIYKYNFTDKSLITTPKNSIVNKKAKLISFNHKIFLLSSENIATGNTINPDDLEDLKKSKNEDTLKLIEIAKNFVYEYGDFASYILTYDHKLDFAFEPVEFYGSPAYTKSDIVSIDGALHIIALTHSEFTNPHNNLITICDFSGRVTKQISSDVNYSDIFVGRKYFALPGNNALHVYNHDIEPIKQIQDISRACGYFDIDTDNEKEFVAFRKNKLIVFSKNYKTRASYAIDQEFAPYPEANGISLLQIGDRPGFIFNTRLFYYLFSYSKNPLAVFKYPFFILVFSFWTGLLLLILRLNTKRLEKEKRNLEEIVSERTAELQSKNVELASKNEEIQTQAEKISEQYEHLEKLDQFKESLTHALVHDLKNPLSQIMLKTSNPLVNQSAGKMLQLIMNMLDVEKYEHAGFKLNKGEHSLGSILEEVKKGQEISLDEKNLALHIHFNDYKVSADKDILIRIFDNLLSNAIRYSPLNQVIDVFAEPTADNFLKISVRNYGESINDEILPYIFDKYRHFGKNEGSAYRTTGLGLTFCKMAVEAHGGKIGVRSNPKEGTNFWFTIPFTSIKVEKDENQNIRHDVQPKIRLSDSDREVLKTAVKQMKEFEIYEISRFHEVLDPLKDTSGSAVNGWISLLYGAIYIQNTDLFGRLIMLVENEQTKNTDC